MDKNQNNLKIAGIVSIVCGIISVIGVIMPIIMFDNFVAAIEWYFTVGTTTTTGPLPDAIVNTVVIIFVAVAVLVLASSIAFGVLYLNYSKKTTAELIEKKNNILIFLIVSFLIGTNIISLVLALVVFMDLDKLSKQKDTFEKLSVKTTLADNQNEDTTNSSDAE